MKYLFPTLVFLFSALYATAQPAMDTIRMSLQKKPHLFGNVDTRNSFIDNSRAKVNGVKVGLSYDDRVHFGVGYNQLDPPAKDFDKEIMIVNAAGQPERTTAMLRMFYISVNAEYTFYQTKHWELRMPLQFGIGQSYYKYDYLGKRKVIEQQLNFIYEPAISVEYKILKWIGVGADVGYRFMLTDSERLNKKFTSPTYAFQFLIYYDEIFKSLFPKSKFSEKL